jgi:hypothetical protein
MRRSPSPPYLRINSFMICYSAIYRQYSNFSLPHELYFTVIVGLPPEFPRTYA